MGKNTEVEAKAIKYVMEYEKKNNNSPVDCHNDRIGYDIKCSNKIIEVKGHTEQRIPFETLNSSNIKALENDIDYFLYIVYDINKKPKLLIINKDFIEKNKKEKISFEIPLRKDEYSESIEL